MVSLVGPKRGVFMAQKLEGAVGVSHQPSGCIFLSLTAETYTATNTHTTEQLMSHKWYKGWYQTNRQHLQLAVGLQQS